MDFATRYDFLKTLITRYDGFYNLAAVKGSLLLTSNVIFSVLNGSFSSEPIPIHISNRERRKGQRGFCLAIRVTGNPLGRVIGTYLHGLFADDRQRSAWLGRFGAGGAAIAYDALIEETLDKLGAHLAA